MARTPENLDYDYMIQVVNVYLSTLDPPTGLYSIKETARVMNIARTKVRKILISMGEIQSPLTNKVEELLAKNLPLKAISRELNLSVSTISTYIPYQTIIYKGEVTTSGAIRIRRYRDRIKDVKERTMKASGEQKAEVEEVSKMNKAARDGKTAGSMEGVTGNSGKTEAPKTEVSNSKRMPKTKVRIPDEFITPGVRFWKEQMDHGNIPATRIPQYTGAVSDRDYEELKQCLSSGLGDACPPFDLVRLHLELINNDMSMNINLDSILRRFGDVHYGNSITRDILVPIDLNLHALHYVIQQAFGWQNSHLHHYELPKKRFEALTKGGVKDWSRLVGLVFQSPMMDEDAPFWDDDYGDGSFKSWLRKKYTWPYVSLNRAESYVACANDIKMLLNKNKNHKYVVEWKKVDEREMVCDCYPVLDKGGKPMERPAFTRTDGLIRTEVMEFGQLPTRALVYLFDSNMEALLERLTVGEVLAFGSKQLIDEEHPMAEFEAIINDSDELVKAVLDGKSVEECYENDTPTYQPMIPSVTDVLYYNYDYGDNWCVRITGSWNCVDLTEAGRVTQQELDEAMASAWKNRRPVCINRNGLSVMDDVGGMGGYLQFLENVSVVARSSNEEAASEMKDSLEWAKGMGWSMRKISPKNLL